MAICWAPRAPSSSSRPFSRYASTCCHRQCISRSPIPNAISTTSPMNRGRWRLSKPCSPARSRSAARTRCSPRAPLETSRRARRETARLLALRGDLGLGVVPILLGLAFLTAAREPAVVGGDRDLALPVFSRHGHAAIHGRRRGRFRRAFVATLRLRVAVAFLEEGHVSLLVVRAKLGMHGERRWFPWRP